MKTSKVTRLNINDELQYQTDVIERRTVKGRDSESLRNCIVKNLLNQGYQIVAECTKNGQFIIQAEKFA